MIPTWKKKIHNRKYYTLLLHFSSDPSIDLESGSLRSKSCAFFFLQMLSYVLALIPFLWSRWRSLHNYNCKSNLWPKCLLLILLLVINFYFKTLSHSNIQSFWLENIKIFIQITRVTTAGKEKANCVLHHKTKSCV